MISKIVHKSTRGRVTEIRVGRNRFTTPTRAANQTELTDFRGLLQYQKGKRISDIQVPPCEIQETVLDLSAEDFLLLEGNNGKFKDRRSFIRRNNRNENGRVKLCIPQLRKQTEPISEESIKVLTSVQADADCLDFIAVPDPNKKSPHSHSLEKAVDKSRDTLNRLGQGKMQILPVLDLDTNPTPLKRRISYLLDAGHEAIAFRYRPNILSAFAVSDALADKDVWIHLSGVPRTRPHRFLDISQIHLMPFFSFDSISSYKHPSGIRSKRKREDDPFPRVGGGPDPGKQPDSWKRLITEVELSKVKGIQKVTRFDSTALGFLNWRSHLDLLGNGLNCNCFLCKDKTIDMFFQEYGQHEGSFSNDKFRMHTRAHELFASHSEFRKVQDEILADALTDYLRSKPLLQRMDTGIEELDFGQTTLV